MVPPSAGFVQTGSEIAGSIRLDHAEKERLHPNPRSCQICNPVLNLSQQKQLQNKRPVNVTQKTVRQIMH